MLFRKSSAALILTEVLLILGVAVPLGAQCPRWRRVDVGLASYPLQAVYTYDTLHIWVSSNFGDIVYSNDGGRNWNRFNLNACCLPLEGGIARSFFFLDTLTGWIAGTAYNGAPIAESFRLRTNDGGKSWTTQLDSGYKQGAQILFLNRRRGFDLLVDGCSYKDTFLVTNDSGKTWQPQRTGIPSCLIGLFQFPDSINGCGVFRYSPPVPGDTFGLMRTRDGGDTWAALPVPSAYCHGARIFFMDSLNGWLLQCEPTNPGNENRFSRTRDGGVTWDSLSTIGDLFVFKALDSLHFWAAGSSWSGASILYSADGGHTWTEQMPGVGDIIVGLDAADARHAYAVGASGYVYIYSPAPLNGLIGDLNQDSLLTAADVVLMVNRAFLDSSVCVPMSYIDFNNDCTVSPADVVLLLNRVFLGGPPLLQGCAGS